MDTKEKAKGEEDTRKNKVRITLTCKNVKNVERGNFFYTISNN